MKKILIPLVLLTFLACDKKEERPVDYAVISGKITNRNGVVTINSFDRTFSEPLDIKDDGSFVDTLDIDQNTYIIFDGKNPLFLHLEPGFNINVAYDVNAIDNTLSFTGKGSEINTYISAKRKSEKALKGNFKQLFSLNEEDFKVKLTAFKQSQDSLLTNSNGIPDDFIKKEKRNLHYAYLNSLSNYERTKRYITKNNDFKVSEGFLSELNALELDNEEDFLFSNDYAELLIRHYDKKANELEKNETIGKDIAYLKTLGDIPNQVIKNGLLFLFADRNINYTKDIETFYGLYSKSSTNEKNNAIIAEKYKKLIALTKGNPSPKFYDYVNYAGGTTSIEDLKGKFVYIDVWATWCGPCIGEIPALQKVEKSYHGKNIEFVSVSIDKKKDFDKWKTMVNDKGLGGIQLFADKDWNSQFVKDYQITGIPRFILIDPKGNIIDANAPRPSSPALIELFNGLSI